MQETSFDIILDFGDLIFALQWLRNFFEVEME